MKGERGFSYLIALFLVAMVSLASLRALEVTATREQRVKEEELLAIGQAFRNAIKQHYESTPGFVKRYPSSLEALLLDSRATRLSRPLRKIYRDPMTGQIDWGIVRAPDGGIMGVHSLSGKEPHKKDGFAPELIGFANAETYRQWQFNYVPK